MSGQGQGEKLSPAAVSALMQDGYAKAAAPYFEEVVNRNLSKVFHTLVDKLREGSDKKVHMLEIGCGSGYFGRWFSSKMAESGPEFMYTGTDISESQVALSKEKSTGYNNLTFTQSESLELLRTCDKQSYDAVLSIFTLFHSPRDVHEDMLRAVASSIKVGGYFVFNTPVVDGDGEEQSIIESWLGGSRMFWSFYSTEWYRQILTKVGFEVVDEEVFDEVFDNMVEKVQYWLLRNTGAGKSS
eukprot:GFYU01031259.1.p1 GENE.GFYU01031259.1~~GFYU01031259.1.p1  ORF type:complete len:242 (-),score=67.52 GFYU01031259.1:359-1084(-)